MNTSRQRLHKTNKINIQENDDCDEHWETYSDTIGEGQIDMREWYIGTYVKSILMITKYTQTSEGLFFTKLMLVLKIWMFLHPRYKLSYSSLTIILT